MKLAADEGVERDIVEALRAAGHEVWYVAEQEPGITDEQVLARSNELGAPLLTCDKDFGELIYRMGRVTQGVMLIRLSGVSATEKAGIVRGVVEHRGEELAGAFVVVTAERVRLRRLP